MPRRLSPPRDQLDIALHRLWVQQPEAILRLATGFPTASVTAVLAERISAVRREADGVALAQGPHGPFLAHIEFHTDTSPARVKRQMLTTGVLLYTRHGGRYPVVGTAVLLDRRSRWDGALTVAYGPETLLHAHFRVLRLYEQPAASLAGLPGLAPLSPLGAGATPQDLIRARDTLEAGIADPAQRLDAEAILYIIGGRRFEASTLRRLLWRSDLMQSSTFREIWEQGVQQGVLQGARHGTSVARRALHGLIAQRFGALSSEDRAVLDAADLDQIEAWIDEVGTASSLDALLRSR